MFVGPPGPDVDPEAAALVVARSVDDDVAFGAALDGLVLLRPGLHVDRRSGGVVAPPHRSRLTR